MAIIHDIFHPLHDVVLVQVGVFGSKLIKIPCCKLAYGTRSSEIVNHTIKLKTIITRSGKIVISETF